mgnify:CR=1 FL=1
MNAFRDYPLILSGSITLVYSKFNFKLSFYDKMIHYKCASVEKFGKIAVIKCHVHILQVIDTLIDYYKTFDQLFVKLADTIVTICFVSKFSQQTLYTLFA